MCRSRCRSSNIALSRYLLRHRGRVVPQHELDENVYGPGQEHDSNALEVLVRRVRKKLGQEIIETRRGFGYSRSGDASVRWASLRLRLVAGGMIAILVALGVAGAGMVLLFQRHVSRTMAADLDVHLRQLLAGIDVGSGGHLIITRQPADPRFEEPLSGLYWQVTDDRDQMLRSRSLWDTTLALAARRARPKRSASARGRWARRAPACSSQSVAC